MANTPEGRIKNAVKKILDDYKADFDVHEILKDAPPGSILYAHWPVQNGMGAPSLDCVVCYYGCFVAIETKAPGKKPTPRQELTIRQMTDAGAAVLVIDGDAGLEQLRRTLDMIKWSHQGQHANHRKHEA